MARRHTDLMTPEQIESMTLEQATAAGVDTRSEAEKTMERQHSMMRSGPERAAVEDPRRAALGYTPLDRPRALPTPFGHALVKGQTRLGELRAEHQRAQAEGREIVFPSGPGIELYHGDYSPGQQNRPYMPGYAGTVPPPPAPPPSVMPTLPEPVRQGYGSFLPGHDDRALISGRPSSPAFVGPPAPDAATMAAQQARAQAEADRLEAQRWALGAAAPAVQPETHQTQPAAQQAVYPVATDYAAQAAQRPPTRPPTTYQVQPAPQVTPMAASPAVQPRRRQPAQPEWTDPHAGSIFDLGPPRGGRRPPPANQTQVAGRRATQVQPFEIEQPTAWHDPLASGAFGLGPPLPPPRRQSETAETYNVAQPPTALYQPPGPTVVGYTPTIIPHIPMAEPVGQSEPEWTDPYAGPGGIFGLGPPRGGKRPPARPTQVASERATGQRATHLEPLAVEQPWVDPMAGGSFSLGPPLPPPRRPQREAPEVYGIGTGRDKATQLATYGVARETPAPYGVERQATRVAPGYAVQPEATATYSMAAEPQPETYGVAPQVDTYDVAGTGQRPGRRYTRRYGVAKGDYRPDEPAVPLAQGPKPEVYATQKTEAEKKAAVETDKAAEAERRHRAEIEKTKKATEDLIATMERRNKATAGTVRGPGSLGADLSETSGVGTRRLRKMMDEAGDDPYKQAVVHEEAQRQQRRQQEIEMRRARKEMGLPPSGGGRGNRGMGNDGASAGGSFGGGGGMLGMVGQLAEGMGIPGAGGLAAMAGPIAGAVAAMHTLQSGMRTTANAFDIFSNAAITDAQKMRAFGESLPVIGGLIASFYSLSDAVTGTTEALRRNVESRQMTGYEQSARARGEVQIAGLEARQRGAENLATAYAGYQLPPMQQFDRSTYGGEIKYHEESQRRTARDARDRAAIQVQAAEATFAEAGKRKAAAGEKARQTGGAFDKAVDDFKAAKDKQQFQPEKPQVEQQPQQPRSAWDKTVGFANTVNQGFWDTTGIMGINPIAQAQVTGAIVQEGKQQSEGKKELSDKFTGAANAHAEYSRADAGYQAAINAELQAGNDLITKRQTLRKAEVEMAKTELEIAKQHTARLEGQTARVGAMMPGQRMEALQALKMIDQHGVENATPEMFAAAGSAAPEWLRKKQQEYAETTTEYKEMQQRGYIKEGTLQEARQMEVKAAQEVRVQILMDETKTAEEVAKRLGPIIAEQIKAIEVKVERDIKANQTNVAGAHAERGQ